MAFQPRELMQQTCLDNWLCPWLWGNGGKIIPCSQEAHSLVEASRWIERGRPEVQLMRRTDAWSVGCRAVLRTGSFVLFPQSWFPWPWKTTWSGPHPLFIRAGTPSPLGTAPDVNLGLLSDVQRVLERPCVSARKLSPVLHVSDPSFWHHGLARQAVPQRRWPGRCKCQMLLTFSLLDSSPPYMRSSPTCVKSLFIACSSVPNLFLTLRSHWPPRHVELPLTLQIYPWSHSLMCRPFKTPPNVSTPVPECSLRW